MATEASSAETETKGHRKLGMILVAVATVIGILALISLWADRQLYDTDRWVETSGELLANQEIRTELANDLTSAVFGSGEVQAELAKALPPQAAPLAVPAAAGLSQLFNRAVNELLQTSAVQNLWEEANRKASETFIAIAEDEPIAPDALGKAQSAVGSTTLDLTKIRATITEKLGIQLPESGVGSGQALEASVQAGDAQAGLEVLAPDQIGALRDVTNLLSKGSIVLLLLMIVLYAIAIAITAGTRLRTITAVGISLIIVGIATLTARKLIGTSVVDELAASDSAKPAVNATWEIATQLMRTMAIATIAYGIILLAGAVLAGPSRWATWVRSHIAPGLRDPMWAAAGTALVILLLIWWSPTPAFESLLGVALICIVLVAGVLALRRQTMREFPPAEQPSA